MTSSHPGLMAFPRPVTSSATISWQAGAWEFSFHRRPPFFILNLLVI